MNQNTFFNQIHNDIEIDKINIISTKLDLLFGLEDESITVKLFQDYKNDYKNNLKLLEEIENFDFEKNSVEVQNKDDKDKQTHRIKKNIFLKSKNTELQNLIKKYRDYIYEYKKQNKKSFLTDALIKYKDEILPLIQNIRKVKYDDENIITTQQNDDDPIVYYINNIKESQENQELLVKDFDIISYKF